MKKYRMIFAKKKGPQTFLDFVLLCYPVSLFPILFFPYVWWWRAPFAGAAIWLMKKSNLPFLRLMTTGNNTILLFWGLVTVINMIMAVVISVREVRPWYIAPVYLAVMFSLCGICSLLFYTAIIT